MFDYLFDLFDNASKGLKFAIISFIFLVICALLVALYVNYQKSEELHQNEYHGTSSRRTVPKTTRTTTTTDFIETTSTTTTTTTNNTETTTNSNVVNPTTYRTTTKGTNTKTTTKKKTTTSKTTTTTTEITTTRKIVTDSTTYPNALDFWEWNIVDLVNEERRLNNLSELAVAADLRLLAEEAADYWDTHSDTEVIEYIGEHKSYARALINSSMTESYNYIFDLLTRNTDITTNPYYKYIGVGVIYYDRGNGGMRSYYNIIIYE